MASAVGKRQNCPIRRMLYYGLIALCLSLAGVAGLQLMYTFYVDRLDRERKRRLHDLELRCKALIEKLGEAEAKLAVQEETIRSMESRYGAEEVWADVIEDR
jgi:hypothetical protein